MSSSNRVRIAMIEEVAYGVTPVAGDFETVRFTSESLSGTPDTVESAQIRTDRQSSGQIVTGLSVGGDISFELAKESVLDKLLASLMLNDWLVSAPVAIDMDVDSTLKTLTRGAGDFATELAVGDIITLSGFANSVNNTQVMVAEIVSALVVRYVGPETLVDESGSGTSFKVADKLTVGLTQKSFSMEKSFLDITDRAINYKGMVVNQASLNVAFGEMITGSFSFLGNDYKPVKVAGDFLTNGRTIIAPATTKSMNGSIDMPFIANSANGPFEQNSFCIQSLGLEIANNFNPQNCIGLIAPKKYTEGQNNVSVSLSSYLGDDNWDFLDKKLTQDSFAVGFQVKKGSDWYGFYLPALQVSFDDPSSGGANQDVLMDMSGTAKVGDNGESQITIYRS